MANDPCAWEKFQAATVSLARSGSIKDRLADAYRNHLSELAEDELPKEIREEFRSFTEAMTREPPLSRGEDAIRATLRKMSNDDADRVALSVVHMFTVVVRAPAPAVRSAPVAQLAPRLLKA